MKKYATLIVILVAAFIALGCFAFVSSTHDDTIEKMNRQNALDSARLERLENHE